MVVVCRSHQHRLVTEQSNPTLLLHRSLSTDAGAAAAGIGRHGVGQGPMRYGAIEVAEDRGAGVHHRMQDLDFVVGRLPLRGADPPSLPAVATSSTLTLLNRRPAGL